MTAVWDLNLTYLEMTKRIKEHFQTNKGKFWREAGERLVAERKAANDGEQGGDVEEGQGGPHRTNLS